MYVKEKHLRAARPVDVLRLARYMGIETKLRLLENIIQDIAVFTRPIVTGWKI